MSVRILHGDVREQLRVLPADYFDCVITSPPYWGLRDYGVEGQIGCERTLGEHIEVLLDVFREVRRVIKPKAAVWLNYGDCYATSPNGRSAADTKVAGKDDRTFRDKPFSTVGPIYEPEHETGDRRGGDCKQRTHDSGKEQHRGRIVSGGYLKPKDLCLIPFRLAIALQEPRHYGPIAREADRAWLAGIIDADGCIGIRREDNSADGWNASYIPYLTVGASDRSMLDRCVEITGLGKVNLKSRAGAGDGRGIISRRDHLTWRLDGQIASKIIRDIFPYLIVKKQQAAVCYALNESQSSFGPGRFKPVPADKIAYRQALYEAVKALNQRQSICLPNLPEVKSNFEQGWWVRSRCIWGKPNGMPDSSGRYRPSVAHEEIFLLSKSGDLEYDADAVSAPCSQATHARLAQDVANQIGSERANGGRKTNGNMKAVVRKKQDQVGSRRNDGFNDRYFGKVRDNESMDSALAIMPERRFLRTYEPEVWHIATAAFSEAHFATFPPALVERCIMASCKHGAHILDPFGGAGTVGLVADRMGFDATLIELNPDYITIAENRIRNDSPLFAEVATR